MKKIRMDQNGLMAFSIIRRVSHPLGVTHPVQTALLMHNGVTADEEIRTGENELIENWFLLGDSPQKGESPSKNRQLVTK